MKIRHRRSCGPTQIVWDGYIYTYRANTGHLLDKVKNAKRTSTNEKQQRNEKNKKQTKTDELMTNGQVTENIWTINRGITDFLNKFLKKRHLRSCFEVSFISQ